jgi:hypothetical protein
MNDDVSDNEGLQRTKDLKQFRIKGRDSILRQFFGFAIPAIATNAQAPRL